MQRVLAVTIILSGVCVFGNPGAASDTHSAVVRGRQTFTRVGCYLCHGYEGQGGAGPRLAPGPLPLAAISAFVRGTTGEMPAYSGKVLSDSDLADIYAFLTSVRRAESPDAIPALKALERVQPP